LRPGQPYGGEAEDALNGKIGGKSIRIDVVDVDKYKRLVSIVWFGSRNINEEMVAEGWSWAYRKYLSRPYASEFISAEAQARTKRIGLWKEYNPLPPWQFRKLQRDDG
jgi:endonuclease YncB( thermonuclease family)